MCGAIIRRAACPVCTEHLSEGVVIHSGPCPGRQVNDRQMLRDLLAATGRLVRETNTRAWPSGTAVRLAEEAIARTHEHLKPK
jgi:hypothetical protein